jgi:hypothetical protein
MADILSARQNPRQPRQARPGGLARRYRAAATLVSLSIAVIT